MSINGGIRTKANWATRKQEIRSQARSQWQTVKKDPQIMGFLGLYWGEGSKSLGHNKQVSIVNSDPKVVALAAKIFKNLDPSANIEVVIRYHTDNDAAECREFWTKIVNPAKVSMIERTDLSSTKRKLPYGTCTVRFSNWKVYHTILEWLECWKEEICLN